MWAIVPNTSDERVGFIRPLRNLNDGIVGVNKRVNNKMKSDYGEVGIEHPPLKVMFTSNLEVRRMLIVDGDNWPVVTSVHQLSVWGN